MMGACRFLRKGGGREETPKYLAGFVPLSDIGVNGVRFFAYCVCDIFK